MPARYAFNRMEWAGSLGDLGTLLPITIGMVLINGMDATGTFFCIGLFYILAGHYYGIPVPVQPMKVIGAYAVAQGIAAVQISAAALIMSAFLLVLSVTGLASVLASVVPRSVIRGVQLSTGVLLMRQGLSLMLGTATFQQLHKMAEPQLILQSIGPLPIGLLLGVGGVLLTLLLLDNQRLPAALVVVFGGMLVGWLLGTAENSVAMRPGLHLPKLMPFGMPAAADFSMAFFVLALPQLPMTLGNATIANADLSKDYFKEQSRRVTCRALTMSMGLACLAGFLVGGIPLCHGAGGLAAHYRFGARTAGSNLIIGVFFCALALLLGAGALAVVHRIPMAVLGVLLLFAGGQLAMTLIDLHDRKSLFVTILMLVISLQTNLAIAFGAGLLLAYLLRWKRLSV